MSRERIFRLADQIVAEVLATEGVRLREVEDLRTEVVRTLTDETRFEESVDVEVRRILSSYSRPLVEGSREWEVLYQKTREEVFKRRFRL
ncbi:MAG: DUF507 family protein [Candidatus Methylomirabilia bacterium]